MAADKKAGFTVADVILWALATGAGAFIGGFTWHYGMKAAEWYDEPEEGTKSDGEKNDA